MYRSSRGVLGCSGRSVGFRLEAIFRWVVCSLVASILLLQVVGIECGGKGWGRGGAGWGGMGANGVKQPPLNYPRVVVLAGFQARP